MGTLCSWATTKPGTSAHEECVRVFFLADGKTCCYSGVERILRSYWYWFSCRMNVSSPFNELFERTEWIQRTDTHTRMHALQHGKKWNRIFLANVWVQGLFSRNFINYFANFYYNKILIISFNFFLLLFLHARFAIHHCFVLLFFFFSVLNWIIFIVCGVHRCGPLIGGHISLIKIYSTVFECAN